MATPAVRATVFIVTMPLPAEAAGGAVPGFPEVRVMFNAGFSFNGIGAAFGCGR
jgi:hypothetical protein